MKRNISDIADIRHSRYQAENLELEEKEAQSKAMIEIFEELEQPTAALKMSFAPRGNASYGKIMQADSYWDVLLDIPCQKCPDRRENGRYLSRNFNIRDAELTSIGEMRDPDFASIDKVMQSHTENSLLS